MQGWSVTETDMADWIIEKKQQLDNLNIIYLKSIVRRNMISST